MDRGGRYLFQNYGRMGLAFTHGEGVTLHGTDGREYLDLVAGIAVNALGYAHPEWVRRVNEQAGRLVHVSNLYHVEEQAVLAEKVAGIMPDGLHRSLFVNSGAEANEGAMKLAVRSTGRSRIVSAFNGFHGRTAAALGATGQTRYQHSFESLIGDAYRYFAFGDEESLKFMVDSDTAAVLVEPIQGEGGVVTAGTPFFRAVRDICDDAGALMVVDEVQTGIGRTGSWLGIDHHGVVPDIVTLAKGLGGGVPIGAVVTTDELAAVMTPGTHGTTFGGNPLVCTAGSAVIDIIREEDLLKKVSRLGEAWIGELRGIGSPLIREVRGRGLMIGIETDSPETALRIQKGMLDAGILVNVCHGSVVRLIPPLILGPEHAARFTSRLLELLGE